MKLSSTELINRLNPYVTDKNIKSDLLGLPEAALQALFNNVEGTKNIIIGIKRQSGSLKVKLSPGNNTHTIKYR